MTHRVDNDIEHVFDEGRLDKIKIAKHRQCWPTAFYSRDYDGDPIFVDRMASLGESQRELWLKRHLMEAPD